MSTVEELEREQLRLSLLALHRRVLFFGSQRDFIVLTVLACAVTWAVIYFFPESALSTFLLIIPTIILPKFYLIDLPRTKSLLAFFEQNHPELCSWLPESALLEARMLYEQKAL